MKVVFVGLPHFSRLTASFLGSHDRANRFVAIDMTTRRGKLRFVSELPTADVVFSHWGTLRSSRALELALKRGTRVVQFWMGSDVLDAVTAAKTGAAEPSLIERCAHCCEAPWTRDELEAAGVHAQLVRLPPFGAPVPQVRDVALPTEFSLAAYVGKGSEEFYGLPDLVRLARDLPDVPIRISGTDGGGAGSLPPSITPLGWSDDLADLYRGCTAFVRIPRHDGFSFSVREALAWGRHVVSSYPYPHCLHADGYDAMRAHVDALRAGSERAELEPNVDGRDFVLREYDPTLVRAGLERVLAA
jgi:hypothetical protein